MTIHNFFDLLFYKTYCNLKAEVSRMYLNYAWWALEPLFSMAVFYVVFGVFMNSQIPHFAVFLLIGTTQWQWFATTVMHMSTSIMGASGLMRTVDIPKVFFPLELFLQDCFKHLFVLGLLAIFLTIYPIPFALSWVSLPVVFLIQALVILAVGLLCAAWVPFFPDLAQIINTVLNIMFFISGIFFEITAFVLPQHLSWMYLNPMAGLIREYRRIILHGQWPDWQYLVNISIGASIVLCLMLTLLTIFNRKYPRLCQQ